MNQVTGETSMGRRVLIADADAVWLEVCERCFVERGFTVETARDGLECMASLRQGGRPDALIIEIDMPWGGGDGVLACLTDEAIPVNHGSVIATGHALPQILSERTGVPISCCLQKPFHVDALLNLVRRAGTACAE